MPTSHQPRQDIPPRPTAAVTRQGFGEQLRALRRWSGLTQKALEDGHPALTDSTISDHERGVRLPRLEWVHAYVTLCLRHRNPTATRPQFDAELVHWRAAWTRLEHVDTTPAPTIPTQATTDPDLHTADSQPAPALPPAAAMANSNGARRRWWSSRRVWLTGAAAAVILAGGAVTAVVTGVFDHTPAAPAPDPIHASGTVQDLRGVEGIDLDTNNRADQEAPGVDISPAATSTHLNAMAGKVTFTVLPEPGPEARQRCVTAVDWMRQIPNIYDLTEGRNICVITDEGRYSMLTITKRASAATGTMNFHYTTWN